MSWKYALAILAIVNSSAIVFNKIASDRIEKKAVGIFYKNLCQVIVVALLFILFWKKEFSPIVFSIGIMGFVNAFGDYFMWRALNLNLSKTVLSFPLMEVLSIILVVIFLGEFMLWNYQLALGVALCLLAMWLFYSAKREKGKQESSVKKWLFFIIGMILIFGTLDFLIKYFASNVPIQTFVVSWPVGQFLGISFVLLLMKQNPIKTPRKTILLVLPVSLAFLGATAAIYWTYQLGGPASMVLPIRGLAITIIPGLAGWFVFKERKEFSKIEWLGFVVGIVGAILILLR